MRCSRCGACCRKTEMLLSEEDIKRLEKIGYSREEFVRYDRQAFAKLRNRHGHCVFYDFNKDLCKVYKYRPLGCRVYPIIYNEEKGVDVDDLCPMKDTVSKQELKRKSVKVMRLLHKIDEEAKKRRLHTKLSNNFK
ncbi:MAG: YkgJ family cysteine cluster protein [Candidatus Bathycorpusculaceae bacterium]